MGAADHRLVGLVGLCEGALRILTGRKGLASPDVVEACLRKGFSRRRRRYGGEDYYEDEGEEQDRFHVGLSVRDGF